MDFIESLAYKRREHEVLNIPVKKKKTENIKFDTKNLNSINILTFHVEANSIVKIFWIITDVVGNIIDSSNDKTKNTEEELSVFLYIFSKAIENNCVIVTYNSAYNIEHINNLANKYFENFDKLETNNIFCIMQNSKSRCGLVRIDGKTKNSSSHEIYKVLFDLSINESGETDDCKIINKCFIQGRIKGWW